ncbi:MAG: prepilin-type N-terminal cleavage/methylation domain-containing protein [Deltaproteobacteria bacterium]|nr:prepilin-type N-terminal cleavage/methylation domain-containing protein [Deltaproteobacteria bacterium]
MAHNLLKTYSGMKRTGLRGKKGFTLVEAMVVVAIIGVLAAIGYSIVQKMLWRSRASEVPAMFNGIIAKEEAFYAEFHRYVSNPWVPAAISGQGSQPWPNTGNALIVGFEQIGFTPDTGSVWNQYRVTACNDVSQAPCSGVPCGTDFPAGYKGPGFVLEARGDLNNDGNIGHYCATSQATTPVIVNSDWQGQDSL